MDGHEAIAFSETLAVKFIDSTGVGSVHDLYPLTAEISNQIQKYAIEKTRLGIPVIIMEEGLHGFCEKNSTEFPVPLQLAGAFDTSLVYRVGRAIAAETRAHGVHMLLAPVLDLSRDPRWGRVEENYGEDPYLSALNGIAMVKGFQGSSLTDQDAIIAEPKHFGVHSVPEAGSNTSPVNIGEREARSSFLYVFERAVREGGAMGIMAAYHEIDGIPCAVNKWLLTDILRKEWGFQGFVLSDLGAIRMAMDKHFVAVDTADILAQTFKAGMNMQFYDFSHETFRRGIHKALETNLLTESELDKAVHDVLKTKFLLGLFENPYTDTTLKAKVFKCREHLDLALEAAQKSICLLKNDKGLLPIKSDVHKIAVIGPLALSTYVGGYSGVTPGISILDGLKERAGKDHTINFEKGYDFDNNRLSPGLQKKAVDLVKRSDIAVVVIGEDPKIIGENKDRADITLDADQLAMIKAIYQTGKPVVAVMFNGRPLAINWVAENIPAIVETWFSGEKGGLAIADVLFGNVNPSGKLPITFPRSVGQIPFYYNHKPTSFHIYVDEKNSPLFCFGHGLSYTSFEYSELSISPVTIPIDGKATISVQIKNTGTIEGAEVVQLYIRDVAGSVTTPILALKGFDRINLKPGESKTATFEIDEEHLFLWNQQMKRVVEPGEFRIMVGSSSADIRQSGSLSVVAK